MEKHLCEDIPHLKPLHACIWNKKSAFQYEFVPMGWDDHCYNKTDPKNNSQLRGY